MVFPSSKDIDDYLLNCGEDDDPGSEEDEPFYEAKDSRWYRYQDLPKANKYFLEKKFEFDKINISNTSNGKAARAFKKSKPPPPPPSPPKTGDTAKNPKPPPPPLRHSSRVRETPKTFYTDAEKTMNKDGAYASSLPTFLPPSKSPGRSWDQFYQDLSIYHKDNGTCNVTSNTDEKLARWISTQRGLNATNRLSNDKRAKLAALGFDWISRKEKWEQQWMEKYNLIKDFHREHGHLQLPSDSVLVKWAGRQRGQYLANNLDENREKLLRAINFRFDRLDKTAEDCNCSDYESDRVSEEEDDSDDDDYEGVAIVVPKPDSALLSASHRQRHVAASNQKGKGTEKHIPEALMASTKKVTQKLLEQLLKDPKGLPTKEKTIKILEALLDGKPHTKIQLANLAGYTCADSNGFRNLMRLMNSLKTVNVSSGKVTLADRFLSGHGGAVSTSLVEAAKKRKTQDALLASSENEAPAPAPADGSSKPMDVFSRLMPLIVELKDLVDEPCLTECGNFLLRVIQSVKKDDTNSLVQSGSRDTLDAGSRLLFLALELQKVVEEFPIELKCSELYLEHMVQIKKKELSANSLPLKRRKV